MRAKINFDSLVCLKECCVVGEANADCKRKQKGGNECMKNAMKRNRRNQRKAVRRHQAIFKQVCDAPLQDRKREPTKA